jgi:hypothetical protein
MYYLQCMSFLGKKSFSDHEAGLISAIDEAGQHAYRRNIHTKFKENCNTNASEAWNSLSDK